MAFFSHKFIEDRGTGPCCFHGLYLIVLMFKPFRIKGWRHFSVVKTHVGLVKLSVS